MQDDDLLRQQLETHLNRLDWSTGISKEMLLEQLVGEPATQNTLARGLAGGVYFSPADVLAALPGSTGRLGGVSEPPTSPPTPPAPEPSRPAQAEASRNGDGGRLSSSAASDVPRLSGSDQWRDVASDQMPERTTMAVGIGAGVIALLAILAWLGRRKVRK